MDISPKAQNTQDTIYRTHEAQEEGRPKCGCFSPSYKGEQNIHGSKYGDKVWSKDWRKDWRNDHPETAPPGDPSHKQTPNPDTIVDAKKCLLTGAWYSYLLRGSASSYPIQMRMLVANHQTEHRDPNGGVRGRTEGAEGVSKSTWKTISTNQTLKAPRD